MLHARPDYQHIQDPSGKIPKDEPVFILRAQDVNAPATLRFWAEQVGKSGGDQAIAQLARDQADRMDAWPVKKSPDLPR